MTIRQYLTNSKIMTDGAFGTYYASKYAVNEVPERANTEHPERVTEIHREYLQAGAVLLRTNSFASNTHLLETDWEHVSRNLKRAAALARAALSLCDRNENADAFIAGDIGPIPASGFADIAGIEEEYYRIGRTLLDTGLRILVFETFPELEHILPAIRRLKGEELAAGRDPFIIVEFAINQFGYSSAGLSAGKLLQDAAGISEIDAVGLNCGVGPAHMQQLLKKLPLPKDKYLVTLPNAGYPKLNRSEITFGNTPAYFAMKGAELADMGSDIIGGCCGTDPNFMEKLKQTADWAQKPKPAEVFEHTGRPKEPKRSGFLYRADGSRKEKKLIAVELTPPFDTEDEKLLDSAHLLKQADVDVLTFPDSPSGRTRVDAVLMAGKVHRETGIPVMPHICCRDKNAIAIRSTLLGAHINDIHDLLVITGDPLPSMVRQTVKAVFNFDSVGLMNIAKEMNEDAFAAEPMCYGGAINQGRRNLSVEIGRVRKKMEAGAEFFLTQPVFGEEDAKRLRLVKEETGAVILVGIMPLISRKNALFMKNEISGVNVPDELIEKYPMKGTREEGEAVGVALARSVMKLTEDFADGYYFSFPFNRIYLLKQIMEAADADEREAAFQTL